MISINQTLDTIMQMDFNEREMLVDILQKRQIDERRNEILQNSKLAK